MIKSTPRYSGIAKLPALLLLAASLASSTPSHAAPPRAIFVHGFSLGEASNCAATFDDMKRSFRSWANSSSWKLETVSYYGGDQHCDRTMSDDGGHSTYHSGDHPGGPSHNLNGTHTAYADIRHLAFHLAWEIWSVDRRGIECVDIVAHSMGGLIARYALARVQARDAEFPSRLCIGDVVTMGTPHGGARAQAFGCRVSVTASRQCQQMAMGSDLLVWMQDNAWKPKVHGATEWSTLGSNNDAWVAADRAVGSNRDGRAHKYFGACNKYWYMDSEDVDHDDYMHMQDTAGTYELRRSGVGSCSGALSLDASHFAPVKAAYRAVTMSGR